MRAIDSNVTVRLLALDDPSQAEVARKVIDAGEIFIPITVVLECEWVLRRVYGFTRDRIAEGFRRIAGLPDVEVEEPIRLERALAWLEMGMDFADALHLAKSDTCSEFVSFDLKLARLAKSVSPTPVVVPT